MATDMKATVGVRKAGAENLTELTETPWFSEERDAFRLAVAVALSEGIVTEESAMTGMTTKWHRQGIDEDMKLLQLVKALGPEEAQQEPYSYAERLGDAGLELLKSRLVDQHRGLGQVMQEIGHLSDAI